LAALVRECALHAEFASGLTTPLPFVLMFDAAHESEVLMLHPIQVPQQLSGQDPRTLFSRLSSPG
jgi:hypothetical protein